MLLLALKFLLFPFSLLYGVIMAVRNLLFDLGIKKSTQFNIPVISIGNITVGGTGKTPHTEYLVQILQDEKVAVLSRGYGRKTKGFLWVKSSSSSHDVGDEPLQIKLKFPEALVAVCEKRVLGIKTILNEFPETKAVILDDAFQHRYVKPSLSILLNDFNRPIYKDWVLPMGRKREFSGGINRADVVITTKCSPGISETEQHHIRKKLGSKRNSEVYFTTFEYDRWKHITTREELDQTLIQHVVLVTGIVNPKPILERLSSYQVTHFQFPDHYHFKDSDILKVKTTFDNINSEQKVILTTDKDASRLLQFESSFGVSFQKIYCLPIRVSFVNRESEFKNTIIQHVQEGKKGS